MIFLKSMVVCLVLANVAYFLWAHGVGQSADAPPPRAPVRTLKLVSEVPATARAAAQNAAAVEAGSHNASDGPGEGSTPVIAANAKRCITVGPFRDVAETARAASTLRARGYDPRQRVVDGDVWAGVWVYLPAPASAGAGDQLLAKLKAAGIDDALEMPGPADGSVISLGLYSEQKRAQARVTQAQALGLHPALADRKRTGNVYWIDVDLKPTDGSLNPADLQGEAGRISRLEANTCPNAPTP